MVATASTFDPLWAFVLGDYDEYRDDEATAKPKYESREPEPEPKQQDRAEQEQATVTSRAAIPKAAKSRLEQKRDAMDKKSKRKLGTRSMHSKAPGSKASESKGSVARSKVAEARSSQSKLSQNSKASQAKASKRKPLETIDDPKSYASEEQEYEAKTTLKLDYLVTKELHAPTKSANKGVTGLTGSKKSIFGWIRKKHRKVRRGVYNAIVERSKVSEARKLGMSMNSKAPKSKASESKSSVPRSKVSETRKLGMPMHSKAPGSKASELKSSVAASKASKEMSSQLLEEGTAQEPIRESYSDVKDAKETLLRYANKVGDYMEDILNGMEKESKMKLGMPMQSKAPGSKASESKSSVAGSKASEATSSQTELAQNSEASQAKATERKPLETIDDSKSTVTAEQESEAKTTEKLDSLVASKELQAIALETNLKFEAKTTQMPDFLVGKEDLHSIALETSLQTILGLRLYQLLFQVDGSTLESSPMQTPDPLAAKELRAIALETSLKREAKTTQKPDSLTAKELRAIALETCLKLEAKTTKKPDSLELNELHAIALETSLKLEAKTMQKPDSHVAKEYHAIPLETIIKVIVGLSLYRLLFQTDWWTMESSPTQKPDSLLTKDL
jgi:hypothetical protein